MEFEFFGKTMHAWKLNSAQDYMLFFGYLLFGIILFTWYTKRIHKKRDDLSGGNMLRKKIRKISRGTAQMFDFRNTEDPLDPNSYILILSPKGLYIFRCVGWGFKAWGSLKAPTWKILDNKEEKRIPNPLLTLTAAEAVLKKQLEKEGLGHIAVSHQVVFTDPFDTPTFYLEGGANTRGLGDLKEWYRSLPDRLSPAQISKTAEVLRHLQ